MSVADIATRARQFSADQPHDVSAEAVAQFNRFVFKRMAEKFGGGAHPKRGAGHESDHLLQS